MRWKFAFGLASDDLFFVNTRREEPGAFGLPIRSKVTTFLQEDEFLGHLIRAGLRDDQTMALAQAVLLSVARPTATPTWTVVDLSQKQMELLHLAGNAAGETATEPTRGNDLYLQAARSGSLPQFYDLLMQAPTALCMVLGPEHRFSFLNARYGTLIGAKSIEALIGTSVLEKYTGVQRQRISETLDRVYRTGEPYVGFETPREFFREISGRVEERFFNTVGQPIFNAFGEIAGIMIQSTDVTEMVLARAVREHREQLLYRQWAELDAIYRNAPIGMLLLDTKDFRILRLNDRQAEILGASMAELLGMSLLDTVYEAPEARELLERVKAGESGSQFFDGRLKTSPDIFRRWLVSAAPMHSPSGQVDRIMLVSQETSLLTQVELECVGEFAGCGLTAR